jgi:hypothetical protein
MQSPERTDKRDDGLVVLAEGKVDGLVKKSLFTTEHTGDTEKIIFHYSQLSLRALCSPWLNYSFLQTIKWDGII